MAVLGSRTRPHRQRQLPEAVAERMNADGGAKALTDRSAVLRAGAGEDHDEAPLAAPDMVIRTKRMPKDFRDGTEARFGGSSRAVPFVGGVHLADENRNG